MKFILYSVIDRIGTITLNRPEKRNALSYEVVAELKEAFTKAEDDEQVKVIVLKANGEAFCSGADLEYLQQLQKFSYEENLNDSNHLKELFLKIYTHSKSSLPRCKGMPWPEDVDWQRFVILYLLFRIRSLAIPK